MANLHIDVTVATPTVITQVSRGRRAVKCEPVTLG
jgi:hypothetical protein